MTSLVEVRDLEYHYSPESSDGQVALSGISLEIESGEYIALVGANGSGKTTLAFHLNGLLLPSSGSVLVNGLDTRDRVNLPAVRRTVGVVFQKPEDQIVALTVEEDVAFGPENHRLPPEELRRRVSTSLRRVGLDGFESRSPHKLSAGQKQRLAIAGVLALQPKLIVLDEPTAMLDPEGRRDLLELMHHLNRTGATIVHITQRMDEAAEARRVVVLDCGRMVLDGAPREVFSSTHEVLSALGRPPALEIARELRARGAGNLGTPLTYRELGASLARALSDRGRSRPTAGGPAQPLHASPFSIPTHVTNGGDSIVESDGQGAEPLISVSELSHSYDRPTREPGPLTNRSLDSVTAAIFPGEILAVIGATGSGKSTLLQHLNGLFRPREGTVRVDGTEITADERSLASLRRRVGLVFQRPEEQIFERYVGDEVAFGPRLAGVAGKALTERVRWAMETVGLAFEGYKDRLSFALSGGEQRKVGIASILALRPAVLLLDEPTAGLDSPARRHLEALLSQLNGEGTTIVVSTHDMDLVARMAARVLVLSRGRLVASGAPAAVFEQQDVLRSVGLAPPDSFEIWEELSRRGAAPEGSVPCASEPLLDALGRMLGLAASPVREEG